MFARLPQTMLARWEDFGKKRLRALEAMAQYPEDALIFQKYLDVVDNEDDRAVCTLPAEKRARRE